MRQYLLVGVIAGTRAVGLPDAGCQIMDE